MITRGRILFVVSAVFLPLGIRYESAWLLFLSGAYFSTGVTDTLKEIRDARRRRP